MTATRWILLVVVLLVVGLATLFTVQNLGRTTDLSLDLWVWAAHLRQPVPVPYLLLACFGSGLLLGGAWGLVAKMSSASRIADLEQDVARASLGRASTASDDPWG